MSKVNPIMSKHFYKLFRKFCIVLPSSVYTILKKINKDEAYDSYFSEKNY